MPSPIDVSKSPPSDVDLDVSGSVPPGLSGRLVGVGRDGVVHSIQVHAGRVSYRGRRFHSDTVVHNLVAFGGSTLAFGEDSPAYELSTQINTLHRVELAGRGRTLAAYPKCDPSTGELHLIARDADGVQAHVQVSAGALTRHSRPILDSPSRIKDLALSRDHAVFVADGRVGVAPRDGEVRTTWIASGAPAPHPIHAHDAGDTVAMLVLTPLFERWTLHAGTGTIEREVLDATPRRFAHLSDNGADGSPRWVWTAGERTIRTHDLVDARRVDHDVWPYVSGDFVVVRDEARPGGAGDCWLVGFVHDAWGTTTDLRVLDAADIAEGAVATVRVPHPITHGLRCTWIPSTHH